MDTNKQLYIKTEQIQKEIEKWPDPEIPERGLSILQERYLVKDDKGNVIESPKELFFRVAHVISSIDEKYKDFSVEETRRKFYNLMAKGFFMPNSPTLRGAGLNINLSACFVLPVEDNRESIFNSLKEAAEIQAFGGGTGFNFSKLRPRGSLISTTKGKSSGPISFMEIYDIALGKTIAQGGTRQGANMGILNYNHADVNEFITVKNVDGRLRNFNISVGCTEEFIKMALENKDYPLLGKDNAVVGKANAKEIFDKIIKNAWHSGDPGIVFLDRINQSNPTPSLGVIESTNPCGEQPLLPYEACNLGSINLRKFARNKEIDYELLREVVFESVHFLDNVIDVNNYPFEKINKIAKGNRKIGLGVMGFADMLLALEIPYGSPKSMEIAEQVMEFINETAKEASIRLAETRGVFPNWQDSIYDPNSRHFCGKNLRLRNATVTTIAPTGTISNIVGVEGGIEPMFSIVYMRRSVFDADGKPKFEFYVVNSEFERIAKQEGFYSEQLIKNVSDNHGLLKSLKTPEGVSENRWKQLQEIFITSHELDYEKHIAMQACFQRHVDNAVSKTINLLNSATEEDVRKAYLLAYKTGLKGITVYRDGCKAGQVLVTKTDERDKSKTGKEERPILIGTTVEQITPHGTAFITLNLKKENLEPYEAFINIGKGRGDIGAIAEGFGRMISLSLKNDVALDKITKHLGGIPGETQTGIGKNKICSLPDAISKGLTEAYFQLKNVEEINGKKKQEASAKKADLTGIKSIYSGNFCPDCGAALMLTEGCQKCTNPFCGYSKC